MSRHRIPAKMKNEDHWLKIMDKGLPIGESIAVVLVGLADYLIIVQSLKLGASWKITLWPVALFVVAVFSIVVLLLIFCEVPRERYMFGGGQKLWRVVLRYFVRKHKKEIYTSNYDKSEDGSVNNGGLIEDVTKRLRFKI